MLNVNNILIIFEESINFKNLTKLDEVFMFKNTINNYILNNEILSKNRKIKNLIRQQLIHTQLNKTILLKFKDYQDLLVLEIFNSFTTKSEYNFNKNFLLTEYNLNFTEGINQYINNNGCCFIYKNLNSYVNNNNFKINNTNVNINFKKYLEINEKLIDEIMSEKYYKNFLKELKNIKNFPLKLKF